MLSLIFDCRESIACQFDRRTAHADRATCQSSDIASLQGGIGDEIGGSTIAYVFGEEDEIGGEIGRGCGFLSEEIAKIASFGIARGLLMVLEAIWFKIKYL